MCRALTSLAGKFILHGREDVDSAVKTAESRPADDTTDLPFLKTSESKMVMLHKVLNLGKFLEG